MTNGYLDSHSLPQRCEPVGTARERRAYRSTVIKDVFMACQCRLHTSTRCDEHKKGDDEKKTITSTGYCLISRETPKANYDGKPIFRGWIIKWAKSYQVFDSDISKQTLTIRSK
jgi:hypothetical protein